jgi:hypothetical protein
VTMITSCTSCGGDNADLVPVRRRYITPETWEHPGSETVLDEVEHWCVSCLTHYPHLEVSPGS